MKVLIGRAAWANGTAYVLGDVVQHGVNAYVCVLEHTADPSYNGVNDPDPRYSRRLLETFSGGTEAGNLTTAGDIVYYGGALIQHVCPLVNWTGIKS